MKYLLALLAVLVLAGCGETSKGTSTPHQVVVVKVVPADKPNEKHTAYNWYTTFHVLETGERFRLFGDYGSRGEVVRVYWREGYKRDYARWSITP